MKPFSIILTLCILVPGRLSEACLDSFAQFRFAWPLNWTWWNGELITQRQREVAEQCYNFGRISDRDRGHTLTAICWSETSFGENLGQGKSKGLFGVMPYTAAATLKLHGIECPSPEVLEELLETDFETQAMIALLIFEDNVKYFENLGYSPKEAWFFSYPRYCSGGNWPRFKSAALAFNSKVAYLKEVFT